MKRPKTEQELVKYVIQHPLKTARRLRYLEGRLRRLVWIIELLEKALCDLRGLQSGIVQGWDLADTESMYWNARRRVERIREWLPSEEEIA